MSVILGKFKYKGEHLNPETIPLLMEHINLWEADDTGIWQNEIVGLGNRIIYNTPESIGEQQPYKQEENGNVITADVRLDNRAELFKKLSIPFSLQSRITDTALILKAYEKWGINSPKHLIGAFAFAIWDKQQQQLFCARDQIGCKPFFYFIHQKYFAFSSELKLFSAFTDFPLTISGTHVVKMLSSIQTGFTTFFEQAKRLEPAHSITVNASGVKIDKYWALNPQKQIKLSSNQEYVERFKYLLEEAVSCRLRTSYPIGCQLSGGLDSGSIAAIANKLTNSSGQSFHTYSNEMPSDWRSNEVLFQDESQLINEILAYTGIKNYHKLTYSQKSFSEEINYAIRHQGGPANIMFFFADRVNSFAQQNGVRTMLSGYLGDEMVSTRCSRYLYTYFANLKWYDLYKECKTRNRNGAIQFTKVALSYLRNTIIKRIQSISEKEIYHLSLLNPKYHKKWKPYFHDKKFSPSYRLEFNNQYLAEQLTDASVENRLQAETLAANPYKIECRYPLSDIRLIEFFLSTPTTQKVHLGVNRLLFRQAMKNIIPENIRMMNKADTQAVVIPYLFLHRYRDYEKIENLLISNLENNKCNFLNMELLLESWQNMERMLKKKKMISLRTGKVLAAIQLIKLIEKSPDLAYKIDASLT